MPRSGKVSITLLLSVLLLVAVILGSCLVVSRQIDTYESEHWQAQPRKITVRLVVPPKQIIVDGRPLPARGRSQAQNSDEWFVHR
jgi:hypothetical protein